jgi:hypothetical protein
MNTKTKLALVALVAALALVVLRRRGETDESDESRIDEQTDASAAEPTGA